MGSLGLRPIRPRFSVISARRVALHIIAAISPCPIRHHQASRLARRKHGWVSAPTIGARFTLGHITLGDISSLSTRTVYDRLVKSIVSCSIQLDYLGILRPEGAFPEISATEIESMFTNGRVMWLTLDDIAYGTAVMMSLDHPHASTLPPALPFRTPMRIMLANDKLVTVIHEENSCFNPICIFTTSRDNQTTVTVQVYANTRSFGEAILYWIAPQPKGRARIKVTFAHENGGEAVVTVREIGTDNKQIKNLGSVSCLWPRVTDTRSEHVEMTFGEDGVIGELPE